jgi:hypothetical protein
VTHFSIRLNGPACFRPSARQPPFPFNQELPSLIGFDRTDERVHIGCSSHGLLVSHTQITVSFSAMAKGRHAIVFGASGLLGWAVVNELLSSYPSRGTFASITAVTNRAVKLVEMHWPANTPTALRLELIHGVGLTQGTGESLAAKLAHVQTAPDQITHAFYFGTQPAHDPIQ